MKNKKYYIETNKGWFKKYFKRNNCKYSLCVSTLTRYNVDSWCWAEEWVDRVIENSNDLEYLKIKLLNLKVINDDKV